MIMYRIEIESFYWYHNQKEKERLGTPQIINRIEIKYVLEFCYSGNYCRESRVYNPQFGVDDDEFALEKSREEIIKVMAYFDFIVSCQLSTQLNFCCFYSRPICILVMNSRVLCFSG